MGKQQNDGAWVEYDLASLIPDAFEDARIVRVFSSEVNALRSAVASGNRVARIRHGETIQEALGRILADSTPARPSRASRAPEPVPEPTPETHS